MQSESRSCDQACSGHGRASKPHKSDSALSAPANLPNLFIVGPAKSGTTALYWYFKSHPQVYTTPVKETNYMAFCEGLPPLAGPGDYKEIAAASATTLDDYCALFAGRRDEPVAVDVSPSYMHYPQAAKKIAELCPHAKIVIVLRNPVECSFSMYSMLRRDNRETCRTFQEALGRIQQRTTAGWDMRWNYLNSHLFARHVAQYLELFPASQLFIRRYEQLNRRPHEFYAELCNFIQVDPIDVESANKRVNVGAMRRDMLRTRKAGRWMLRALGVPGLLLPPSWRQSVRRRLLDVPALEMTAEDRKLLVDFFAEDISRLGELLSWDLSDWLATRDQRVAA